MESRSNLNLDPLDPNKSWTIWKNTFLNITDKHAPLKRRRVSGKRIPWLTKNLIAKKRHNTYLKQKAVTSKLDTDWSAYKLAKNNYNRLIGDTVRQHYQDKLQSNSGNLKKTWKTINKLINKSRRDGITVPELRNDNGEVIDCAEVPNAFNQYFTDLGEQLSVDIPKTNTNPASYFASFECPSNPLFRFREISESDTLYKIASKFKCLESVRY